MTDQTTPTPETAAETVSNLEADLAILQQQQLDLDQRRAALAITTADLRRRLAAARADGEAVETADQRRTLTDLTARLRSRIAATPARSHTAHEAAALLKSLEAPDSPLSTAAKIDALTAALKDYSRGVLYEDPQRRLDYPRHAKPT